MKYCAYCGQPLKDDDKFCSKCGRAVKAKAVVNMKDDQLAGLTKAVIDYQKSGSDADFTKVYNLSHRNLYAFIRSMVRSDDTTEDLLQETYIKIMKSVSALQTPEAFLGWAIQIARNTTLDYLKNKGEQFNTQAAQDTPVDEETGDVDLSSITDNKILMPENFAENEAFKKLFAEALEGLSPAQKQVFTCRVLEDMSIAETAQALDMNENTVKTNDRRARANIAKAVSRFANVYGLKLVPVAGISLLFYLSKSEAYAADLTAAAVLKAAHAAGVSAASSAAAGGAVHASSNVAANAVNGASAGAAHAAKSAAGTAVHAVGRETTKSAASNAAADVGTSAAKTAAKTAAETGAKAAGTRAAAAGVHVAVRAGIAAAAVGGAAAVGVHMVNTPKALPDGRTAYMAFDSNAQDSVSKNDGKVHGSPTYKDGVRNDAIYLDGVKDYITYGDQYKLDGSYTFSVWVDPESADSGNAGIFSKYDSKDHGPYAFYLNHDRPAFWILTGDSSYENCVSSTVLDEDKWSLLTYTYDKDAETMTLYVDGAQDTVWENVPAVIQNKDETAVGRQSHSVSSTDSSKYKGGLDDLRIYNRALSQDEVTDLYNGKDPSGEADTEQQ